MGNAAQNDLRDKMRLEARFNVEIRAYFDRVVDAFGISMANRVPLNVHVKFDQELADILVRQYLRVEKVFDKRIRNILPKEIDSTVEEDKLIDRALQHLNRTRSAIQARNINDTTMKNIQQSLIVASMIDDDTQEVVDGRVIQKKKNLTGFELILSAKKILKRKLFSRTGVIVNTETQVPAEAAKLTEAEVLGGSVPSLLGGSPRPAKITKIWVSLGDSNVRGSHLEADGQERDSNKPFTVGGFGLMMPGDSSLGAPMVETVNCRCAAVYNDKEVVAIRYRKLSDDQGDFESFISLGQI
jgi:hypothetical protein